MYRMLQIEKVCRSVNDRFRNVECRPFRTENKKRFTKSLTKYAGVYLKNFVKELLHEWYAKMDTLRLK